MIIISESNNLRDVHKIKELLDEVKEFESFKTLFPYLKPLLSSLGVDTSSMEEVFDNLEDIAKEIKDIAVIPDQFNDIFADQGWILFERMNMDVAKKALSIAESGDYKKAEKFLVDYFDPDFIERELRTMIPLESYKPRMELTQKALNDYKSGRYHACIPVVLAQIDGLVSDLHEKQRGFFAEDTKMEAWDSLAAHSKGLNKLARIFRKGRRKTTTDPIKIPFRHGIMHGRDLGYANKTVAAKSWAALFAVREWAIKVERDELEAPPEEPSRSINEKLAAISEIHKEAERWKNWSIREVDFTDIEKSPSPSVFDKTTPEKALSEFLQWWEQENYGYMCRFVPHIFSTYVEKPLPIQMREIYEDHKLTVYVFREIDHSVPSIAEITMNLSMTFNESKISKTVEFRMTCEDNNGDPVTPSHPKANWVVMNWNAINLNIDA